MDKWKDGLKYEQALFDRTVPATTWVQKVQQKKDSLKIFLEKQMLLIKREKVISQKEV